MSCTPGYRSGWPWVTEAMSSMSGSRGTGYLGTGVYFYRTMEGLKNDTEFEKGRAPGIEMKCACKEPYIVPGYDRESSFRRAWEMHDFSRKMLRMATGWDDDLTMSEMDWIAVQFGIPKCLGDENLAKCKLYFQEAIDETKKCVRDAGGKWGAEVCDQPINRFLSKLGYDCFIAGMVKGDDNDMGAVIFRNALEPCTGPLKPYESIPEDKVKKCIGPVRVIEPPK